MKTKYITDVTTRFNPFNKAARTPRLFLASLPPDARRNMKINVKQLPRSSQGEEVLEIRFSA